MGTTPRANGKLTIGRLATAAGVGIGTIRLYQKRGLLSEPKRPAYGGFRLYGAKDLERLLQIRGAQELGFTLAEIQQLFAHLDSSDCQSAQTILDGKLSELKDRVHRLQLARKRLAKLRERCIGGCSGNCLLRHAFGAMKAS